MDNFKEMEQGHADKIKQAISLLTEVLSGEEAEASQEAPEQDLRSQLQGMVKK